ncbi:hypothetical protein StoSoilB5_06330 [Arthrobacter sp. StoSoilB5]|nr:hypothetical protein StoSoilB5_06330 [Arthrobacter sp. StoSoilB5]
MPCIGQSPCQGIHNPFSAAVPFRGHWEPWANDESNAHAVGLHKYANPRTGFNLVFIAAPDTRDSSGRRAPHRLTA